MKNFRATLFFQGKRKLLKNREREKIFNTVYIHLGAIRAIWASVVCNLDQSHDWLHGHNLVGDTGDVSPHFFRWGWYNTPCPPTFFSWGCVFGEVSKLKVMFVTFCVKSFSSLMVGYTRKELQPFELTSKVTTEFAHNGTSRVLHKERYCRIDIISELKCI